MVCGILIEMGLAFNKIQIQATNATPERQFFKVALIEFFGFIPLQGMLKIISKPIDQTVSV